MWMLLFVAVLFIASLLLAPKPKLENAKAASLSDFSFPMTDEGTPVFLFWGRVRIKAPNVLWYGDFFAEPIKEKVKTGMFSSKKITVGYRYHLGIQMALGLFTGAGPTLRRLWWGDKEMWTGTSTGGTIAINDPNFMGGHKEGGGLIGTIDFNPGTFSQMPSPYLEQERNLGAGDVPGYRGLINLVFRGNTIEQTVDAFGKAVIPKAFQIGERPNLDPLSVEIEQIPNLLGFNTVGPDGDCNPMEMIYDIITSDWGRMALASSTVDLTSFTEAAQTLEDEEHGIAYMVRSSQDARDVIEDVLKQIDGMIYEEPTTRKLVIKLIRNDYDVNALVEFDQTNVLEVTEFASSQWEDTYNQVRVVFPDRASDYEEKTAFAQDLSNVSMQSRVRSSEVTFAGVSNAALAQFLASRELNYLSIPITKVRIVVDRRGAQLRPGDVVKFSWPEYGISQLVCRVQQFDYGELDNNRVAIDLVQDRFAISNTIFSPPPPTLWERPDTDAPPIENSRIIELPRFLVSKIIESETTLGGDNDSSFLGYFVQQPSDSSAFFTAEVGIASTDEYGADVITGTFNNTATLVNDITIEGLDEYDTTDGIQITNVQEPGQLVTVTEAEVETGANIFIIGDEIFAYRSATHLGAGVYRLNTIWRGVLDTSPRDHAAGERVWFFTDELGNFGENFFEGDEDLSAQLYNRNGFRTSIPEGPFTVGLENRSERPYPPDQVELEGVPFLDELAEGATLDLTWHRRNRNATSITRPDASDEAPHETTEYYATISRQNQPEEGPEYSLGTGTSGDLTDDKPGLVTLRLYSRVDGLDCLYPVYRRYISRNPFLLAASITNQLTLTGNMRNLPPIQMDAEPIMTLTLIGDLQNIGPIELEANVDLDLVVTADMQNNEPNLLEASFNLEMALTGDLLNYDAEQELEGVLDVDLAFTGDITIERYFEAALDVDLALTGLITQDATTPLLEGANDFYYTGAERRFIVPEDCFAITIDAWAGGGANAGEGTAIRTAGRSGFSRLVLRVVPGDEIRFSIGQGGRTGIADTSGGPGGWPDGGDGGLTSSLAAGGGGGSTHIYINDELVLVVGGGAGETGTSATGGSGGSGGGEIAGDSSGFTPSFGATQTEPGFNQEHLTVHDGVGSQGGNGWDTSITTANGAGSGGGGGYFGGAGGHSGNAGSGGSGFILDQEENAGVVLEAMTYHPNTTNGFWTHGFEDPYGVGLASGVGQDGNDGKVSIFVHADSEPYDFYRPPVTSTPTNHTTDVWRWKKFIVPADMWIEDFHIHANADSATTVIVGAIFNHSVAPLVDGPGSCIANTGLVTGVVTGQNDLPLLDPVFVRQGQIIWLGTISDVATYSNRQDSTANILPPNYSCSNAGFTVDPNLGGIGVPDNTWGQSNSKSNVNYGFWVSGTTDLQEAGDSAIAVVPFTMPTTTGTLDVTSVDLGGRVPKVALIFYAYATANADVASVMHGFGMASRGSGRQQTFSAGQLDNAATSDCSQSQIYNRVIHYAGIGGTTVAGEATVSDWLSDGVRLNFTTVDGTARQCFAILIAGEDVEVGCQRKTDWNAGTTRMDGFGFKPTFVIWAGKSINTPNATGTGAATAAAHGFGLGVCDSQGTQGSIAWGQSDGVSQAGRPSGYISNAAIESSINSGAATTNGLLTLQDIDDAGFTISASAGLSTTESYIVAVRIPNMESRVLQFDSRTTTGVQNVTGAGFEPEFALLLGSSLQSYNTNVWNTDEASGIGYAAFTANDGIGLGFSNRVVDPTDCNSGAQDDDFIVGRGTSPRTIAADFDGFTSDGFDLDYTAVHTTATKNLALVLGRANYMDGLLDVNTDIGVAQLFNQGEGGYSMLMSRGSGWASSSTATFFVSLANTSIGSNLATAPTEVSADIIARRDATISKLTAHITANLRTTNVVIRFRKNAGNGNQVITVPPLSTGFFSDVTNTDTVAPGDRFCVSITTTAPNNTLTVRGIFALCKSTTGNPHVYWGAFGGETTVFNDAGDNEAHFYGACGSISGDGDATDTAYSQTRVPVDCVVSNLRIQVVTNPRTTDTVAWIRHNGADSAVTVTIPATTTGSFEDTTNSFNVTAGDTIGFRVLTSTGGGTLNFNGMHCMLAMDNDEWPLVAHSQINNQGEQDDQTRFESYHALGGRLNFVETSTSIADIELEQIPILHTFFAHSLYTILTTKAGSNFVIHLNGDGVDLTNTVTATGVGTFEDTTNEDEIPSGTRLCVRGQKPATVYNHDYVELGLVMSNFT